MPLVCHPPCNPAGWQPVSGAWGPGTEVRAHTDDNIQATCSDVRGGGTELRSLPVCAHQSGGVKILMAAAALPAEPGPGAWLPPERVCRVTRDRPRSVPTCPVSVPNGCCQAMCEGSLGSPPQRGYLHLSHPRAPSAPAPGVSVSPMAGTARAMAISLIPSAPGEQQQPPSLLLPTPRCPRCCPVQLSRDTGAAALHGNYVTLPSLRSTLGLPLAFCLHSQARWP